MKHDTKEREVKMFTPKNPAHAKFKTGLIPSPRHVLAGAMPFKPPQHNTPIKARAIVVPSFLEMWLNDVDGDCVSAEEAAAIAFYSVMLGLPEVKITDATVLAFCNQFDVLNGAELPQVMQDMASTGMVQGGIAYKDGPYNGVDYSNETILQAAIEEGPVKIGIDSAALPTSAGNKNGWYATGGTPNQYNSEDHCVGLWNYGPSNSLFAALNTPMPTGFPAQGYHLYTWSTVGVVDHAWIMSTCGEAWLRNPTSINFGPSPTPGPTPTPTPATLQQQIDALFAAFEARLAKMPKVLAAVKALQAKIDALFVSNTIGATATISPTIITLIQDAIKAAAAAEPQYTTEINAVGAALLALLPYL